MEAILVQKAKRAMRRKIFVKDRVLKKRSASTDMIRVHVRAIVIQQQRSVRRISMDAIFVI